VESPGLGTDVRRVSGRLARLGEGPGTAPDSALVTLEDDSTAGALQQFTASGAAPARRLRLHQHGRHAACLFSRNKLMEISVMSGTPEKFRANVVVAGAFADGILSPAARAIDKAAKGKLFAVIARGDPDHKAGASVLLHDLAGAAAQRVLVVSLGKRDEFGDKAFRDALGSAARALAGGAAQDAAVALADVELAGRSLAWRLRQAARLLADGAYRFDAPRAANSGKQDQQRGARQITLLIAEPTNAHLERAVRRGQAIAEGMALAKDLGNLPGNVCNPTYLADAAQALGKEFNFKVEVLERSDMEKLGMGSALSVGLGSHQPCKFIVMHYHGSAVTAKPVVLVGKGMTFDSAAPTARRTEPRAFACRADAMISPWRLSLGFAPGARRTGSLRPAPAPRQEWSGGRES
jgi:leucyl aminopeptidase